MKRFLIAATLCLSACSNPFAEADLLGDFVASYGGDIATLTLKADHSYTHLIQRNDGQSLKTEGVWKVWDVQGRHVVELPNFVAVPSFRERQMPGWSTQLERTWLGRIQLCFDSDVGYCYIKQAKS